LVKPHSRAPLSPYSRTFIAGLVLSGVMSRIGYAGCSLKPYDSGFPFSNAALASRNAFFASLCDESFTELVVFPDRRLKERFSPPSNRQPIERNPYPEQARRLGFEGNAVVAYVIETDGSVEHVVVIQSSGHQLLDDGAVAYFRQYRFDTPGALDGIPVRVLATDRIPYQLKGSGPRLPAGFTDAIISGLGNRIIDFCNRGDVDSLYEEFEEVARHELSRTDVKQQLRLYNGLYGQIAAARYEGILGTEVKRGVQVYELVYSVDLARPGDEDIVMGVTVAEHVDKPRVFAFWIDRKIVLHRRR
jgi:TonB family protein